MELSVSSSGSIPKSSDATRWPAVFLSDQQELTAQQALRKQREREVYLLENDKEYIETIARDKLDMMKDGETIFRLDPSKGATPAPKSP